MSLTGSTLPTGTILGLVDFCHKVVSRANALKRSSDGQLKDHGELKAVLQSLGTQLLKLDEEDETDEDLRALIAKGQEIGNELQMALRKVAVNRDNLWSTYRKALKTVLKEEKLAEMEERLSQIRDQICSRMLEVVKTRTNEVKRITTLTKEQVDAAVASVDALREAHEIKSADLVSSLDDTRNVILGQLHDSRANSEQVVQALSELKALLLQAIKTPDRPDQPSTQEFLETLSFRGMNDREEMLEETMKNSIDEGHASTFNWLLMEDDSPTSEEDGAQTRYQRERQALRQQVTDAFIALDVPESSYQALMPDEPIHGCPGKDLQNWLADGSGIFWIWGKPASGKSTLMKAMMWKQQMRDRLMGLLQDWGNGTPVLVASFYFFKALSSWQRSHLGMLVSLLRQILAQNHALIDVMFAKKEQRDAVARSFKSVGCDEPPWTLQELSSAFKSLRQAHNLKLYLHIDGIDEMDGSPKEILDVLSEMVKNPCIKIMAAGRWTLEFENALPRPKTFNLDSCTALDILAYTVSKLQEPLQKMWSRKAYEKSIIIDLIAEIATAADGMFLWVKIVVDSLVQGSDYVNTPEQMMARVREYPQGTGYLDDLYNHLLESIDPRYRFDAAKWLLWCLRIQERYGEAKDLRLIFDRDLGSMVLMENFSADEPESLVKLDELLWDRENDEGLESQCMMLQQRIRCQCQHFFDFDEDYDEPRKTQVVFAHRTLFDFVSGDRTRDLLQKWSVPSRLIEMTLAAVSFVTRDGYWTGELAAYESDSMWKLKAVVDTLSFQDTFRLCVQVAHELHHLQLRSSASSLPDIRYRRLPRWVQLRCTCAPFSGDTTRSDEGLCLLLAIVGYTDDTSELVRNRAAASTHVRDDLILHFMQFDSSVNRTYHDSFMTHRKHFELDFLPTIRQLVDDLYPDGLPSESHVFERYLQSVCNSLGKLRRAHSYEAIVELGKQIDEIEFFLSIGANDETVGRLVNFGRPVYEGADVPETFTLSDMLAIIQDSLLVSLRTEYQSLLQPAENYYFGMWFQSREEGLAYMQRIIEEYQTKCDLLLDKVKAADLDSYPSSAQTEGT